ncbi:glycerate kinase [Thiohalophilus sp.]|uniref:glycerate kinase type-2 family protein n=1 Tax=Thiohalophilus sp. TaxID=3028392 RepID=UPI00397479C2
MPHSDIEPRSLLLSLYQAGLKAVAGETVTRGYLRQRDWQADMPMAVLACGKAAVAMARGAESVLGQRIEQGLLITKHGYRETGLSSRWQYLEAGHPLPDDCSLQAGQQLLDFVAQLPPAMPLLSLISGGTSALLEVLPPGVSLADLQRVNAWLLGSGLDIAGMNRVRKVLSCLKGGRLLNYLGERPVLNLMISDVRGDDPAVIGSGLLTPDQDPLPSNLPDWLTTLLAHSADCPPGRAALPVVEPQIVASNQDACEAVTEAARTRDLPVTILPPHYGPVAEVASELAGFLRSAGAGVYIRGGEPTLELPPQPGRGGRNQHLALSLAASLAGEPGISVLCGATDGSDGPGNDAGAIIDGTTVRQASDYPGGATGALDRADSGTFLAEAGALISTGPTGTNVMDLVIAIKTGPRDE